MCYFLKCTCSFFNVLTFLSCLYLTSLDSLSQNIAPVEAQNDTVLFFFFTKQSLTSAVFHFLVWYTYCCVLLCFTALPCPAPPVSPNPQTEGGRVEKAGRREGKEEVSSAAGSRSSVQVLSAATKAGPTKPSHSYQLSWGAREVYLLPLQSFTYTRHRASSRR